MTIQSNSLKKAKRHFFDISLLLIFVLGIFLYPNTAFLKTINKNNILELVNQERQRAGLEMLAQNETLDQAASKKAEAIIASQMFAHEINDQKFSSWVKDSGYKYSFVGENLAIDFVSAEGAVKAWLESVTHKQNILNPRFQETGIAVREGTFNNLNTILVVQIFGTPLYQANLSLDKNSSPAKNTSLLSSNALPALSYQSQVKNNPYYFTNNYLNSSQSKINNQPVATINENIFKVKNINNSMLFQSSASALETFNMAFLLTLVLSLAMTFVYLTSNHLLRKNQIQKQHQG